MSLTHDRKSKCMVNKLQTISNDKIGRRTEIARSGTKINWDERSADGIGADRPNGFRPSENPVSSVLAMSVRHSLPILGGRGD